MNPIIDHFDIWTSAWKKKASGGRGGDSPYGIQKLRELILELAVRGRLVPQDPKDEPASVLLEKIAEEKARLVKEGKIRKPKKLPEITEAEKPFDLPDGWILTRLGELSEVVRGVTYKKHDAQEIEFNNSIALLRANNIGRLIDFENIIYIPHALIRKEQMLRKGDLLVAMSSGSANLVGKAAKFDSDTPATFGAFCGVVRAISSQLFSYLDFFLQTPLYREQTKRAGKGIGINNLNKTALEQLIVVLPPLQEQHRIAAKVDELMTLCDRLEQEQTDSREAHQVLVRAFLDRLIEGTCSGQAVHAELRAVSRELVERSNGRAVEAFDLLFTTEHSIDQLKQTILQLAVMGRLVPQDPNDEPASVLLEKIAEEKARLVRERKIRKPKKLPEITEAEKPFDLPEGWVWARLNDCYDVRDGTHDSPKPKTEGFPLVTSKNLYSGKLDLSNVKCISEEDHRKIIERSRVEKGDILFAMIGSIGNPVIVDIDKEFSIKNVALFKYYNRKLSVPRYLQMFLEDAVLEMKEKAAGGVQSFISLGKLRSYVIALPPLPEQHRIVNKVDELMALCDALKARIQEAETIQRQLADAVVEEVIHRRGGAGISP